MCKFLTANIRPVFVFDGPNAPVKRGAKQKRVVNEKARKLMKEALDGLGVSHMDAPAEAEAECCKLQILSLVDAVWSQDSDCLMFGCTLWIRELRTARETGSGNHHIGNTDKDHKRVRVVRAENLKIGDVHLKKEGCVLFAMLVGGDYDRVGLRGCGTTNALKLVKASLGRSLCSRKSQQECDIWRESVLPKFLAKQSINIVVPKTFPSFRTLQKYNNPETHSDSFLRNAALLSSNFDQPPREAQLLRTSCIYFNFWSKKYYNHIGPVLLSRFLAERDKTLPRELVHEIKLVPTKPKKTGSEEEPITLERKLTFSPFGVTVLKTRDEWERLYSTRPEKTDTSFNENQRVTCEIPTFLLQDVLPLDVLEPLKNGGKKQASKRKIQVDLDEETDLAPKKRDRPRKMAASSTSISDASPLAQAGRSNAPVDLLALEDEQIQEAMRRSMLSNPTPSAYEPSNINGTSILQHVISDRNHAGLPGKTTAPTSNFQLIDCIDLTED
jgi:Holliday junction resolvase YEN1